MPRVPTYDNLQTSITQAAPRVSGPMPGEIAGQQAQQVGRSLADAGGAAERIALSVQDQVNQTKVNDAVNKAREAANALTYDPQQGYLNLKGDAALTRPDGQALPDEYGAKYKSALSDIAGGLTNDVQRRVFAEHSAALTTSFTGDVQRHMLSEYVNYSQSVQDGTIKLASDTAERNWSDPSKVAPALDAAKAATVEKGRLLGWSGSQTDAALLATASAVHTKVVMSALENNNPTYALGYLDRYKGQMSADDILRVQGQVNQQVWANQALGAVQSATAKVQPQVAPTDFDRLVEITKQTESGGKRFAADGSLITSKAGALGEMQVMPATAANPGFGIKPAQPGPDGKVNPDELARVGREYLQALLQKYGDPAKAWAAYNAGPGAVDKALKDAKSGRSGRLDAAAGGDPSTDWVAYLPKETRDYVAKNVAALQSNGGQPARPTEADFVNTALAQLPPGAAPQVVKMTRDQAVSQFAIMNKSLNEQGDNAVADAQRWLAKNNGGFDQMPASLRDAVTRFAPGKVDDLIKYAKVFDKGENQTDLVLYNRLAAHPEEMAGMTDAQFELLRPKLSQADFKHFSNERANYLNGKTDESAGGINGPALRTALNDRLLALDINPTPKPTDTTARERVGTIQKFVRDSIFAAQQQVGKKFTAQEVEQHIDNLFAKSVTFKGVLWGTNTQSLLSMQAGDIPKDTRDAITQAFQARGIAKPTDEQVLRTYWLRKSRGE